ncbi:MAG: putative porin, partial [Rhodospirillaceae bacterium]|nr:putative porin [Rhodospirillaceae bacterium]
TTGLYDLSAPQVRQKGNSLFVFDTDANNNGTQDDPVYGLAPDFRIANLTLVADFAEFLPVHVIGSVDWARNVGFDRGEILARTGQAIEPETDGYQARLTIGYPKVSDRHEWQAFVGYRYLERDAVLDAFTDSDFHLGGTNHKGFMIGGSYGLYKNTWLAARWTSSDEISGLPLSIDVLQLDLNAKF